MELDEIEEMNNLIEIIQSLDLRPELVIKLVNQLRDDTNYKLITKIIYNFSQSGQARITLQFTFAIHWLEQNLLTQFFTWS